MNNQIEKYLRRLNFFAGIFVFILLFNLVLFSLPSRDPVYNIGGATIVLAGLIHNRIVYKSVKANDL